MGRTLLHFLGRRDATTLFALIAFAARVAPDVAKNDNALLISVPILYIAAFLFCIGLLLPAPKEQ